MYFLKPLECRKKSAIWVPIISALMKASMKKCNEMQRRPLRGKNKVQCESNTLVSQVTKEGPGPNDHLKEGHGALKQV